MDSLGWAWPDGRSRREGLMRVTMVSALAAAVSLAAIGVAQTQTAAPKGAPAAQKGAPAAAPATCPGNPNALMTSRTVEVDTTGGPAFGFDHFKQHDFLQPNEVVLTFDDGPWPSTPAVLNALAAHCAKATFFPIGKHSTYHPD